MSNWNREKKKKDLEEFNLAKFISEDRCVVCGNSKTLEKVAELKEGEDTHPVISVVKEYFFIVCPDCMDKISEGLCITCWAEKEYKSGNTDFVYLDIVEHLAQEIIRLRSELTKWIPEIQKYKKEMNFVAPKKDVKKLFRKRKVLKNG